MNDGAAAAATAAPTKERKRKAPRFHVFRLMNPEDSGPDGRLVKGSRLELLTDEPVSIPRREEAITKAAEATETSLEGNTYATIKNGELDVKTPKTTTRVMVEWT